MSLRRVSNPHLRPAQISPLPLELLDKYCKNVAAKLDNLMTAGSSRFSRLPPRPALGAIVLMCMFHEFRLGFSVKFVV